MAGIGRAPVRWTMECVGFRAACDFDLPAADNAIANGADPFVVERIPAPVIIHFPKDFESLLGVQPFLHGMRLRSFEIAAYRARHGIWPNEKS